jgi:hypothetical protein
MREIPEDIDNIASAIVRAQFAEDDDAEWGMYLLIAKALHAERKSRDEERDRLREENESLRERGQAFANQVRHVVRYLNGQAYSSTLSELNAFDAALSPLTAEGREP